jgi:hypothetical protein
LTRRVFFIRLAFKGSTGFSASNWREYLPKVFINKVINACAGSLYFNTSERSEGLFPDRAAKQQTTWRGTPEKGRTMQLGEEMSTFEYLPAVGSFSWQSFILKLKDFN